MLGIDQLEIELIDELTICLVNEQTQKKDDRTNEETNFFRHFDQVSVLILHPGQRQLGTVQRQTGISEK